MDGIVVLVEDNDEDADLYEQLLEANQQLDVRHLRPLRSLAEYAGIIADRETGTMILDERLGEQAEVGYTGLQLANFIRSLRPELPVYVLTNYPGDIPPEVAGALDYTIDKRNMPKASEAYVAIILRAMQRYDAALTNRQHRLKELLDHKVIGRLDPKEAEELQELLADIERPFAPIELEHEQKWQEELQKDEDRLRRLEDMANQIQQLLSKNDKG